MGNIGAIVIWTKLYKKGKRKNRKFEEKGENIKY
jgi:hypothetical protein